VLGSVTHINDSDHWRLPFEAGICCAHHGQEEIVGTVEPCDVTDSRNDPLKTHQNALLRTLTPVLLRPVASPWSGIGMGILMCCGAL